MTTPRRVLSSLGATAVPAPPGGVPGIPVGAPTVAVLKGSCSTVGEAFDIVEGQRMPEVARHDYP
eukprot:COSAG01_NODE_979_length_12356_cov_224.025618_14_plen_65_part_00